MLKGNEFVWFSFLLPEWTLCGKIKGHELFCSYSCDKSGKTSAVNWCLGLGMNSERKLYGARRCVHPGQNSSGLGARLGNIDLETFNCKYPCLSAENLCKMFDV